MGLLKRFGQDIGEIIRADGLYSPGARSVDDLQVFNDIIIDAQTLPSDRSVSLSTASADLYGVRSMTRGGLLITSTAERDSYADWMLDRWKDSHVEATEVTLLPQAAPSVMWPVVRDLEVGKIVTLNHTAVGLSTTVTVDGITHDMSPGGRWETSLLLSPSVEVTAY